MERRYKTRVEAKYAKKQEWLSFLPENPGDLTLEYHPYLDNANNHYSVSITKTSYVDGKLTIEEITVSEIQIRAATDWFSEMYSKVIDQHQDEKHALLIGEIKHIALDVDQTHNRFMPVLEFVNKKFAEEMELIKTQQEKSTS